LLTNIFNHKDEISSDLPTPSYHSFLNEFLVWISTDTV